MAREIEGRNGEADDVEGDYDEDNQVKVEKLRWTEERFAQHEFGSYEAGVFANVGKNSIFRFDYIHQHSEDSEHYWDSLGEEKIHQEAFEARLLVPSYINILVVVVDIYVADPDCQIWCKLR